MNKGKRAYGEDHRRGHGGAPDDRTGAYEKCLCYELSRSGLEFKRQVHLPISYECLKLDCGYRLDPLLEDSVIVELKTVDHLLPVHSAQLLTYPKLSGRKIGLLMNFNEPALKDGLKRLMN
jgi:GxxExxY protein